MSTPEPPMTGDTTRASPPTTGAGPAASQAGAPTLRGPTLPPDPRIGAVIDKYKIVRVIGRGGMGVVYEAENIRLDRLVALKVLPDEALGDPQASARFLQEAKAAARLNHPNVVAVYDADHREGVHYIAMELVRGASAQDRIVRGGAMPWPEATRTIAAVCRALGAAHAAGLVHRDIKPANILIGSDGAVKLADFGLAKATGRGHTLTGPNAVIGTPQYMSPEQCRSETLDGRSDLYSLGATYFALLTGKPPYDSDTHLQTMFRHCHEPPPDPRAAVADLPEGCAGLIRRAMGKSPAERYGSAAEMLVDLEVLLSAGGMPPASFFPSGGNTPGGLGAGDQAAADTVSLPGRRTTPPARRPPVGAGTTRAMMWATMAGIIGSATLLLAISIGFWGAAPEPTDRDGWKDKGYAGVDAGSTPKSVDRDGGPTKSSDLGKDAGTKSVKDGDTKRPTVQFGFRERYTVKAHTGEIMFIAFSPNGEHLATASADSTIRVWAARDGAPWAKLDGHTSRAVCAVFIDNETLISGGADGTIRIWDVKDAKQLGPPIKRHTDLVTNLALSPDRKNFVAVGGRDGFADPEMKLHAAPSGDLVRHFPYSRKAAETDKGHTNMILSAAYNADGTILASCGSDDSVRLWDPAACALLKSSWKHPRVDTVAFVPDGKRLVSAAHDGTIQVWDLAGFSPRRQLSASGPPYMRTLSFTPDGRLMARGAAGVILVFDMTTETLIGELKWHRGNVPAAVFSPDGKLLASGDSAGQLKVWDVPGP